MIEGRKNRLNHFDVTSARRFQLGIFFPKGSDQWRKKKLLQNQPLLALKGVIFFTSPRLNRFSFIEAPLSPLRPLEIFNSPPLLLK